MAKLGEVCLLKAGKFVSANDISPEYNKGLYPCFGGNGIRGYVADYRLTWKRYAILNIISLMLRFKINLPPL